MKYADLVFVCQTQMIYKDKIMIRLNQFDRIDHLMIETDDPQACYEDFYRRFALPQAWPLITSERYASIGMNFGNANIEFISFKERFGVTNTEYSGLSGVCLTSQTDCENIRAGLNDESIELLDGEDTQGYKTFVIASKEVPTVFVCYYKFNTDGWKARLSEEYKKSNGGAFGIAKIEEVCINNPLLEKHEFKFDQSDSVKLRFSKTPEVRLKSAQSNLIGKSIVVGETLFSFC
jgi:hypothetical protein